MITIDGSHGEAGGQILRTAIGLSCVTGEPCRIENIRANRPVPGLRSQHLVGIESAARMSGAKLSGAKIGSTAIEFWPKAIKGGFYKIDVGTAGAVSLVLQTLVLPAFFADKKTEFEITGGTHVEWSPTIDYFRGVFSYYMEMIGCQISTEIIKYGFYPKGGGKVFVEIFPSDIKPLKITKRGKFLRNDLWSIASDSLRKNKVAERQAEGAKNIIEIDNTGIKYVPSNSPGSSVDLHSHYENCVVGSSALGKKDLKAENVGKNAALVLKKQIDSYACIDENMADQLLPYIALASGFSEISIASVTKHAETNMWVIERFLPVEFKVKNNVISCEGVNPQT